jgi:polyisoprenoid-binding protein YceI
LSTASSGTLPATGVWNIDSAHSTVSFSVQHHAVATFRSSFTNLSGAFDAGRRHLAGSVAVADMTLTGLDRLKRHLLTPDFFNADEFPTFGFTSTDIRQEGGEIIVAGELALRGVTKPITATGSARGPQLVHAGDGSVAQRIGIDLELTIDRREWGINFNNEVAEGIANLGWDVTVEAALELILGSEND